MLKTNAFAYLNDILNAANAILDYLKDCPTFDDYLNDRKTRRAVEREFEIIGEAMNRVLKLEPTINISDARKIVDFRNFVIHDYNRIDNQLVWRTSQTKLPQLIEEVSQLLPES